MKTILVADDDKKITLALSRRLEASGYAVLTAPNGLTAIKLAVEHKPDLLLLDIWMPAGLGFSVAERLQELGLAIPIIFLTASRKPGLWAASQEIGAAGYIEKPYDPEKLTGEIERALARSASAA